MKDHPLKPAIIWAAVSILVLLLTPFIIILLPSALTLFPAIFLLLAALFLFFREIVRQSLAGLRGEPKRLFGSGALLVGLLLIFSNELTIVQERILFGYKAVNNRLQPALLDGDHYLADRLLFTRNAPSKGEIYVIRTPAHHAVAARLIASPGETLTLGSQTRTLGGDKYGFDLGGGEALQVVPRGQILARATVIYGSYDPQTETIRWERSGMAVN
jgi:hypothetical protein